MFTVLLNVLGGDLQQGRGKPVMIEPNWKEARGIAISSPLDSSLVVTPGACKNQPLQLFGVRVGGGARWVM